MIKTKKSDIYNLNLAIKIAQKAYEKSGDDKAYKDTTEKLDKIYSDYYSTAEKVNFAFAISTRASKYSKDYWGEVYELFPILEHVDIEQAYNFLKKLPPFEIAAYVDSSNKKVGSVVFVPVLADITDDYRLKLSTLRAVNRRVDDAMSFISNSLEASYVGLGGILPKLTNYGQKIKNKNLHSTTGHAGTTWLLFSTLDKVLHSKGASQIRTIGFIGGGGIGRAILAKTISTYGNKYEYQIYDKRDKVNQENKAYIYNKYEVKINISSNNEELIDKSEVIISAITSFIELDSMDLSHKIFIDDSQPGSFSRKSIHDLGGKLLWVVGHSDNKNIPRRNDKYKFGPLGLLGSSDYWGCEAEIITLYHEGLSNICVNEAVTPNDVEKIGKLLALNGFAIAEPQSFGRVTYFNE